MARRFKIRSTTPGEKRLTLAALAIVADYPAEAVVKDGTAFANASLLGTYPTTATSFAAGAAAQLVTDVAAVEAKKGSILNTATILGVPGTYDPAVAAAPAAPTLAAVNDGTGVSVALTLAGAEGTSHRILYRTEGDAAWTAGPTALTDGVVHITALTPGRWEFVAVSEGVSGELSLPSKPAFVVVSDDADPMLELIRQALRARLLELVAEFTAKAVTCPKRYGLEKTYQDKEIVLLQSEGVTYDPDNRESKSLPSEGYLAWHRRFLVYFWKRVSDKSADDIDALLNAAVAAVADKLTDPDRPYTDPVCYVDIEEDLPVSTPDRSCDGRMIVLHVMFEHREGDASAQS